MVSDQDIENLEKEFIVDYDAELKNIREIATKCMEYCTIDKSGYVSINDQHKDKGMKERINLVLIARLLANQIQEKTGKETPIPKEVSSDEIRKMLGEDRKVVNARLKDLRDEGYAIPSKKGVHYAASNKVEEFLSELKNDE